MGPTRAIDLTDSQSDPVNSVKGCGFFGPYVSLWRHRRAIIHIVKQQIVARYAATIIGLYWIVLMPLLFICMFMLVRFFLFGRAAGWDGSPLGVTDFTATIFNIAIALVIYWQATDIITSSPKAVRGNAMFVKSMAFPVEALPWVTIGTAIFQAVVRSCLLTVAILAIAQTLHWTIIFLPVVILPLIVIMVGVAYLFSAIGAYLRDLDMIIGVLTVGLLLMSGVLRPLSRVPEPYYSWLMLNPIAFTIEEARGVLIRGDLPDWTLLATATGIGLLLAWLGFAVFQKVRARFADVL